MKIITLKLDVQISEKDDISNIITEIHDAITNNAPNEILNVLGDVYVDPCNDPDLKVQVEETMMELCGEDKERIAKWLKNPNYYKFVANFMDSEFELKGYKGRFWYDGPAVECGAGEMSEVFAIAGVKCDSDNMGLDMIIYPKS